MSRVKKATLKRLKILRCITELSSKSLLIEVVNSYETHNCIIRIN